MAVFSGKDGKVIRGVTSLADITAWKFQTQSKNFAYASSATDGYQRRVPGIKDGGGEFAFKLNPASPLADQLDEGSQVTLKLYVDATHFFSVPAVIDEVAVETHISSGEVVGGIVKFSADGAWTKPNFGS